jgi:hypothetical protein
MRHPIARLSASALSHHDLFWVAFIINVALRAGGLSGQCLRGYLGARKTRHQKLARETTSPNSTSVAQFPIRRPLVSLEMPRHGAFCGAFTYRSVETGLAGWGGRIRNFAFRMIVIESERFRRGAALKPAP